MEDSNSLPCAEKMAFDNEKEANASAVVAENTYGKRPKVYRCEYCGLWHLSSS